MGKIGKVGDHHWQGHTGDGQTWALGIHAVATATGGSTEEEVGPGGCGEGQGTNNNNTQHGGENITTQYLAVSAYSTAYNPGPANASPSWQVRHPRPRAMSDSGPNKVCMSQACCRIPWEAKAQSPGQPGGAPGTPTPKGTQRRSEESAKDGTCDGGSPAKSHGDAKGGGALSAELRDDGEEREPTCWPFGVAHRTLPAEQRESFGYALHECRAFQPDHGDLREREQSKDLDLQSHLGDLCDENTIHLTVGSDGDTSDEENAAWTHRLFEKIPDRVPICVTRRTRSAKSGKPHHGNIH